MNDCALVLPYCSDPMSDDHDDEHMHDIDDDDHDMMDAGGEGIFDHGKCGSGTVLCMATLPADGA